MDKKQLENNIIKVSSLIFSIPNKNDENEEFRTLKAKLADLVWRWAALTFSKSKLKNATKEVMECIIRSLKSYKGEIENYIIYIKKALTKEINRANQKLYAKEKTTVHLPDKKQRKIRNLIQQAEQYGKNINNIETQKWLSDIFGYSMQEITQLLAWYLQSNTKREYIAFEDEKDIFECTNLHNQSGYLLTEEVILLSEENTQNKYEVSNLITKIELLFSEEKENTANQLQSKTYLAALLTRQFLEELGASNCYECSEIVAFIKKTHFCNSSILQAFIKNELPTQQEVAKIFGKDKTDASRKLKTFLKKNCQLIK